MTLERIAGAVGGVLLAPPAWLKQQLDNKLATRAALVRLGLTVPDHTVVRRAQADFDSLARHFGTPIVVQRPVGSAGVGTWLVYAPEQLRALSSASPCPDLLLVSRYGGEVTVNVHVFAGHGVVRVSPPSIQATGIPELTDQPAGYCGSDFTAVDGLDADAIASIHAQAEHIGRWLDSLGYIGIFGVDFVVEDRRALPIEINPRFQGSSWLLSALERAEGRVPLSALHVTAWQGRDVATLARRYVAAPLSGSFVVVHRRARAAPWVGASCTAGVHALTRDGRLVRSCSGISPADAPDGEVVVGGLPAIGAAVDDDAVLGRLSSREQLVSDSGRELSPLGIRAVGALRRSWAPDALLPPLTPVGAGDPCVPS